MKRMKKLALLLAASLLALGLMAGCGDSSDEEKADISGAWRLTTVKNADGDKQTLEEYCTSVGIDSQLAESIYEFDGDKTVKATLGGYEVEGSYVFDGSTITVTFDGKDSDMKYDKKNDNLYASDANTGLTSYLERQ